MDIVRHVGAWLIFLPLMMIGCVPSQSAPKRTLPSLGLITTPASYYSTPRARYLGEKYKENLDRLVERIVRNPKTANLQFANNIASVGGIGFFTHAATKNPDERYLEVILGVPDLFETKGEYSKKIDRLFSLYGSELLSILASDSEIDQEKGVTGYGLNFAWRKVAADKANNRVSIERGVVYFSKEKVRRFLKQEITQTGVLGDAVIFAVEDDGPMNLVSYKPPESKSDIRPPIQEETLAAVKLETKTAGTQTTGAEDLDTPKVEKTAVTTEKKHKPSPAVAQPKGLKGESERPLPLPVKPSPPSLEPAAVVPNRVDEPSKQKTSAQVAVELNSEQENKQPASTTPKPAEVARVPMETIDAPAPTPSPQSHVSELQKEGKYAVQTQAPIIPQIRPSGAPAIPSPVTDKISPQLKSPQSNVEVAAPKGETALPNAADASPEGARNQPANERIALLRNMPSQVFTEKKSLGRQVPKTLEGFIIQIAFGDRVAAQRWAETLEGRGYTVSVTEVGGGDSVRLRLGNFVARDDADRQLRTLKREGLTGIIVNLPQGYRPEARSQVPEESQEPSSHVAP